jgi:hypothetical protein
LDHVFWFPSVDIWLTFFSTVGDIAYADAWVKEEQGKYITPQNLTDKGAEYDKILNGFYDEVEDISEDVPYMVAVGEVSSSMFSTTTSTNIVHKVITRLTATMGVISPFACPAN